MKLKDVKYKLKLGALVAMPLLSGCEFHTDRHEEDEISSLDKKPYRYGVVVEKKQNNSSLYIDTDNDGVADTKLYPYKISVLTPQPEWYKDASVGDTIKYKGFYCRDGDPKVECSMLVIEDMSCVLKRGHPDNSKSFVPFQERIVRAMKGDGIVR